MTAIDKAQSLLGVSTKLAKQKHDKVYELQREFWYDAAAKDITEPIINELFEEIENAYDKAILRCEIEFKLLTDKKLTDKKEKPKEKKIFVEAMADKVLAPLATDKADEVAKQLQVFEKYKIVESKMNHPNI